MVDPRLLRIWDVCVDSVQINMLKPPCLVPALHLNVQNNFRVPLEKFSSLLSVWDLFLERCRFKDWTRERKPTKPATAKKYIILLCTGAQKAEKCTRNHWENGKS